MEQQWQSLLSSRLKDGKLTKLLAVGFAESSNNAEKLVTKDFEHFCVKNPQLSDEQIAQLRLALDTFRACKGNFTLVKELLSSTPGKVRFTDAVLEYYSKPTPTSLSDGDTRTLRLSLFEQAPTAVIAGLVTSEKIPISPPKVQSLVATALRKAVENGVNISRTSVASVYETLDADTSISNHDKRLGYECVAAIQRLRAVITDPLHLSILIKRRFVSAYDIASADAHQFVKLVAVDAAAGIFGIPGQDASNIWKQAGVVNLRNDRAWADLIQQREQIRVLAFDQTSTRDSDGELPPNLETLFRENDSIDVEEHTSVLSPAAYLVDLLQLLRYSYPDAETPPKIDVYSSLLTVFLERRPDIEKIQLSKANTITLVKYTDLVNEILESYIARNFKNKSSQSSQTINYKELESQVKDLADEVLDNEVLDPYSEVFNPYNKVLDLQNEVLGSYNARKIENKPSQTIVDNERESEAEALPAVARIVISPISAWGVYEDILQRQVYPMKQFPFNAAQEAVRAYLGALGSSLYDLYRLFQPRVPFGSGFLDRGSYAKVQQVTFLEESLKRRLAAEYLKLGAEDFTIICGEAFQSPAHLFEIRDHRCVFSDTEYAVRVGRASTSQYWGFASTKKTTADDQMIGKVPGVYGLNNIKQSLLPRSGLDVSELLAVLKTEFIAKRFVITVENDNGLYSGKLEDMRLCNPKKAGFLGLEEHLTIKSCDILLSFIKLWKKLGWSLPDTDAALVTLALSRLSGSAVTQDFWIDAEMIVDLAAIKQLSELASMEIDRLLPLWGSMRTEGPEALYKRLFCSARLLRQYPVLLTAGSGTQKSSRMVDLLAPLLSALKLSYEDYQHISRQVGLDDQSLWTLDHVTAVYRYALFCSILDIPISQYQNWLSLNVEVVDPLAIPRTTIQVVKRWQDLKEQGFTADLLLQITESMHPNDASLSPSPNPTALTVEILSVNRDCEQKYAAYVEPASSEDEAIIFSAMNLLNLCSEIFDIGIVEKIHSMVEGGWSVSAPIHKSIDLTLDDHLARKVTAKSGVLRIRGVLSDAELARLMELAPDNKDTIVKLQKEALVPKIVLEQKVNFVFDRSSSALLEPLTSKDAVRAESKRISRRKLFMQLFVPIVSKIVKNDALTSKVSATVPTLSRSLASILLNDAVGSETSLLKVLGSLKKSNDASTKDTANAVQGYLSVPTTDTYKVAAEKGISYTIAVNSKTYHIEEGHAEHVILTQGQLFPIKLAKDNKLQGVKIGSSAGIPLDLSSVLFVHQSTADTVSIILKWLSIAANVISKFKLSDTELIHFQTTKINMLNLSMSDLQHIGAHVKARDFFKPRSHRSLMDFYQWCSDPANQKANDDAVSEQIASTIGLPRKDVQSLLKVWPNMASNPSVLDANTLLRLHEALSLTKLVPVPLEKLQGWCALTLPTDVSKPYEAAKYLEAIISTRSDAKALQACESISHKKRDALIQYLMVQPSVGNTKILDIDSLFEYFLIDVQMGPQQQTSRIKQAISTIQLFIQRSLLGLEKQNGIPTTAVKRSTWAWMSKFTLWQANRKVFLYPENWVDESLRDDKSQQFKTIEAVILQSNLNLDTINSVVRQYIYGVNEIADLQIQAYYWQPGDHFHGKYHLFARTRSAPYKYYYRILQVRAQKNWYPWFKLEVEIPAHEVDWDGKNLGRAGVYLVPSIYRGRLFLFIPQILLKTPPKPAFPDGTFRALAEKKVSDISNDQYWEIKMGWVENRNGQWSKKEVSLASVEVQGNATTFHPEAKNMPSVASFQFRVSSRFATSTAQTKGDHNREILVIDVYRWFTTATIVNTAADETTQHTEKRAGGENVQLHVGRFELRGTQMVVSDFRVTEANWKRTIPTHFSQLHMTTESKSDTDLKSELVPCYQFDPHSGKAQQPIVALAPRLGKSATQQEQKIIWTISYNKMQCSGALALVIERAADSYVDSYFGFPKRDPKGVIDESDKEVFSVHQLTHDISQPLMEVATCTDDLGSIYQILDRVPHRLAWEAFGGVHDEARELATPYAIYNWELGFHLVLLLMERLLVTQQFELALQIANRVFDPSANDETHEDLDGRTATSSADRTQTAGKSTIITQDKPLSNLDKCWKFVPFQSSKLRLAGSTKSIVEKLKKGPKTSAEIDDWLANPFDAHSLARGRPAIYMKRFIIKYIEILVAAGDAYFREGTLESLPLALQHYVEASQLFGTKPEILLRPTKPVIKTYRDIRAEVNDFASAAVDMELDYPFFVDYTHAAPSPGPMAGPESPHYNAVLGMVRSSYFAVPANPQIAALRDLIDDRFFKIRNSLDINGNFRCLALFEPPLDPLQLVRSAAAGGAPSTLANFVEGPTTSYRFVFLLQKAFEICAELKSLGEAYLSIKEKRDAEALAALRAKQDVSMHNLAMRTKQLQRDDAMKAMEVLEVSQKSQAMRLKYYLALTGESLDKVPEVGGQWHDIAQSIERPTKDELVMSPHENMEMIKLDEAEKLSDVAKAIENTCSILKALPEFVVETQPMGVGAATQFDASKIAEGMMLVAAVTYQEASARTSEASRVARKATLIRQLQDRRLQANQAGYDIVNTGKQIESQRIKLVMCDTEIKMQEQQIADVTEIEEYLRSKYTNESLYAWMDASARQILYQTYLLAMDAARSAEKALTFELGPKATISGPRLAPNYWDGGRQGAFAAQNMYLDLKRFENLYLTRRPHDYEITKNVSLQSIDPWALLRLQENGRTEFVLPEVLFDFDFPGHYCRRVRSVQLTIPCLVGPYASVSCTLKLLEHGYRLRQNLSGAAYYPAGSIDLDTRYHTNKIAISSVALSNSQRDPGVFELSFSGSSQYGPFEGAGAVSRWSLELPTAVRQFDYRTISDVILHVNYTSLEGGAVWQEAASDAVTTFRTSVEARMHTALFDLHDSFLFSNKANLTPQAELRDVSQRLPFWTRGKKVDLKEAWVGATKGTGIISKENMPKVNGQLTTCVSLQDQAASSGVIEAMQGLDDAVDLAWTNEGTLPSATAVLSVEIPGLKPIIEAEGAKALREGRLWLLLRYELS